MDKTHPPSARSIPACTGEPKYGGSHSLMLRVYPRVYGGTESNAGSDFALLGLSPRVRGNRVPVRRPGRRAGSIPACTGEPPRAAAGLPGSQVYPRVYGGTRIETPGNASIGGLSPRVRGNLTIRYDSRLQNGSIPACTGEPPCRLSLLCPSRVYPRVYGGTCGDPITERAILGLSPRVRGNLGWRCLHDRKSGSIPACTGEPETSTIRATDSTVYPRVYGGTSWCRQLKVKLSIGLRYRFYTFPSFLIFSKKTNGT